MWSSRFSWQQFLVLLLAVVVTPVPCLVTQQHGYTWSLLLFVVPLLLTCGSWLQADDQGRTRRAVFGTLTLLIPMGIVLTVLWADDFFVYPNTDAVMGLTVPTFDLGRDGLPQLDVPVPLEEILFYVLGFAAQLSVYLAATQVLGRPEQEPPDAQDQRVLLRDGAAAAVVAMFLVALGWTYKNGTTHPGFPSYFAYLMLVPGVTTATLYRPAHPRIHWPALTVVLFWVLATSVLWEVLLALPNGWWGYRADAILGLNATRMNGVPVEAILVWFLAPWATVITYEAMYALQAGISPAHEHVLEAVGISASLTK